MHPEIDNPEYVEDKELYKYSDIGSIGFDLWQVGKMYCVLDRIVLFLTKLFFYCDASRFGFTLERQMQLQQTSCNIFLEFSERLYISSVTFCQHKVINF